MDRVHILKASQVEDYVVRPKLVPGNLTSWVWLRTWLGLEEFQRLNDPLIDIFQLKFQINKIQTTLFGHTGYIEKRKMRAQYWNHFWYQMSIRHLCLWQLKKSKSWEPFWNIRSSQGKTFLILRPKTRGNEFKKVAIWGTIFVGTERQQIA